MLHVAEMERVLREFGGPRGYSGPLTRRSLAGLAGLLPAWAALVPRGADAGSTQKKRRKKRKQRRKQQRNQPENNAFGCLNVGEPCNGDSARCCSGICDGNKPKKGKKDQSRCLGHDASICQTGLDLCLGVFVGCSNGGACTITTGNAPFCAGGTGVCTVCARDPDCVAAGFGIGAACVVCASECPQTGSTVCFSAG